MPLGTLEKEKFDFMKMRLKKNPDYDKYLSIFAMLYGRTQIQPRADNFSFSKEQFYSVGHMRVTACTGKKRGRYLTRAPAR